jgi:ABC-type molybdate transport system substrate-binding protein
MRRFALTAVALAALAVAGCSSSSSSSPAAGSSSSSAPAASSSPAAQTGTITVFAAASLMGTFTQLGQEFEAAHPGDTVKFSFGASSVLATQINSGAPADVNASTLYPIAALTHSQEPSIAQAFVAYVLSPTGEQVLKAAGFAQP